MLACRLCLALGIDDPEQWLQTASERKLTLWRAFYRLEPWGAEFHRSATQSAMTSGVMAMIAAGQGQKVEMRSMEDFMPSDWADAEKRKQKKKRPNTGKVLGLFAKLAPTANKRRMN